MLMTTLLLASAAVSNLSFEKQARTACHAPTTAQPRVAGIRIEPFEGAPGDLPGIRVTDGISGSWMNIYHDAVSGRSARARAACLGAQLRLLSRETGNVWSQAQWFSVTFTSDAAYVPPRVGKEHRWTVQTEADGSLGAAGQNMVVIVMPHEQTHAFQQRAGAHTPRWFHEGHAEWVGRRISAVIAPAAASSTRLKYKNAVRSLEGTPALAKWGGMIVKREALARQASPEDRQRMSADPTFTPPGPFKFGPDDLISDERNTEARYQAAWQVFADLERAKGADAVSRWVGQLTAKGETVNGDVVVRSAIETLGVTLAAQLT